MYSVNLKASETNYKTTTIYSDGRKETTYEEPGNRTYKVYKDGSWSNSRTEGNTKVTNYSDGRKEISYEEPENRTYKVYEGGNWSNTEERNGVKTTRYNNGNVEREFIEEHENDADASKVINTDIRRFY